MVLQAMATMEGAYKQGSRPARNLNPLDLTFNGETVRFGATSGDPRFAVFPDLETGWKAGVRWLSIPAKFDTAGNLVGGYLGATMRKVIFRFAPPSENDPQVYLDFVCKEAGVGEDDLLTPALLALPANLNLTQEVQ